MSTIYTASTVGPWCCDDTAVAADGHFVSAVARYGPPALDGYRAATEQSRSKDKKNTLIPGGRLTGLVHTR